VLYGSLFLSGILVIIIAPFFSHLVKFFPPVVTGSVVTIIGINLMPVAMNQYWRSLRLYSNNFDVRIFFFQNFTYTR
ncbi:hypothetical protein JVV96_19830, partial [Vibrio cholerae O1]|nr:hypothetical protein [Vibrio cholerae O1]